MPELPEVESVVRTLRPRMVGATIVATTVLVPAMVRPHAQALSNIHGKTLQSIDRIGKFIIFFFSGDVVVVSHLRMEGKYYELANEDVPRSRFARILFHFKDGRMMVYDDMRKFGTFEVTTRSSYLQLPSLKHLGLEPMQVKDATLIHQALTKSNRPIKSLLLDQTILLGLGNIYADEVLFATALHPLTKGQQLTLKQTEAIIKESQRILLAAIQAGGTRIRSYHSGGKIDGRFTHDLLVYGQEGKPCSRCQHRLAKMTIAGRGSHYCPRCQHHPDFPYVIAVTGEIATGKSTLIQTAQALDLPTISADEIVSDLYQRPMILRQLKSIFPEIRIKPKLDRFQLLHVMVNDGRRYQKLIRWLFPLVKQEIEKKLKRMKAKVCVMEVPLLFQSDLDDYADVILGVEMPQAKQRALLTQRQPQVAEMLWVLNERNRYRDYLAFVDVRLNNQSSLTAWKKLSEKTLVQLIRPKI